MPRFTLAEIDAMEAAHEEENRAAARRAEMLASFDAFCQQQRARVTERNAAIRDATARTLTAHLHRIEDRVPSAAVEEAVEESTQEEAFTDAPLASDEQVALDGHHAIITKERTLLRYDHLILRK